MDEFIKGFIIAGGLIVAIGAQNAFVLKCGLLKKHVFGVVMTCFACDICLITIGVFGVGQVISNNLLFKISLSFIGAGFLLVYGIRSYIGAWHGTSMLAADDETAISSKKSMIISALAVTLLNPHVYLDTVVIIGGVSSSIATDKRILFTLGALFSSFAWFFSLGYGARILIPLFKIPRTWQILDFLIGCFLLVISYQLFAYGIELVLTWLRSF